MSVNLKTPNRHLRLSRSPGNSPSVVSPPTSPIRSIHLDMEESIHNQADHGMRTIDLLDDADDERSPLPPRDATSSTLDAVLAAHRRRHGSQDATPHDGVHHNEMDFLRLTSDLSHDHRASTADMSDSTYDAIEEESKTKQSNPVHMKPSGPGRLVYHSPPRATAGEATVESITAAAATAITNPSTALEDKIVDAHAMTLQALLRDSDAVQAANNTGKISGKVQLGPDGTPMKRKVSFLPPPIDVDGHKYHVPDDIIRTPYPFKFQKHFSTKTPIVRRTSASSSDSFLTLSIRRSNAASSPRVARISIPFNLTTTTPRSMNSSPPISQPHEFDDYELFSAIKHEYRLLSGPYRFFSARSLRRITVGYSSTISTSPQPGSSHMHNAFFYGPREPCYLAAKGLTDTFSEEKLMAHFKAPIIGKARYAWVHWANRLAMQKAPVPVTPVAPTPRISAVERESGREGKFRWDGEDKWNAGGAEEKGSRRQAESLKDFLRQSRVQEVGDEEGFLGMGCDCCVAGLQFVEGWSVLRMVGAFALVVVLAILIALLWIFFGVSWIDVGYQGAGERVAAGLVMGIFALLLGLAGIGGWCWMSWLIG